MFADFASSQKSLQSAAASWATSSGAEAQERNKICRSSVAERIGRHISMAMHALCQGGLGFKSGQEVFLGPKARGLTPIGDGQLKRHGLSRLGFHRFPRLSSYPRTAIVGQITSDSQGLGIVITGGSSGLGFALARKFLEAKDRVVICGRDETRLNRAIHVLQEEFQGTDVGGLVCDVSRPTDVETFASFASERLGIIDRWLNNAGEVTSKKLLADVDTDEIIRVSGTNVIGSLLCCREAIRVMRGQPLAAEPRYHIFNMGFSQWGAKFTKSACTHKATKIALTQLTESLSEELKASGISSVGVHNLSPGLVLTDLLLKDSTPVARRFFNTLAEEPDTAATILAPKIRAVEGSKQRIEALSPASAVLKVLTGFPQIISGGRFFDKDGNRVVVAGKQYKDNGVEVLF
ncbi:hypothetical protein R1flu_028463 [Riccia fluitans]|uniref:Uncharacterized protein n=1 Tax=Riccia fluitans TaxID=41844 RepID=A0ABD1XLR8_9MARC